MRLRRPARHLIRVAAPAIFPILQSSPLVVPPPTPKLWTPKRVYLTNAAREWPLAEQIASRASARGSEIIQLKNDRIPRPQAETERKLYAEAKSTLAVVVAPPSSRKLQPIPPSADWQFHLAQGCPAHCQYCYLAGSLSGPPITRVYANLPEILGNLNNYLGTGTITSRSENRSAEGTTFEASCYTDPLALEHLTGSLAESIRFFGAWDAPVQLRWTTKFDNVELLLALPHGGRTRVRFSLNAESVARNFEGGTSSLSARLSALRRMALAGYPIGITVAPIMRFDGWEAGYTDLIEKVAEAVKDVPALNLTAELITHRFTPTSKEVLLDWYPRTPLDMNEADRAQKRTKFGSVKYVYPSEPMKAMRKYIENAIAEHLPSARILYWT